MPARISLQESWLNNYFETNFPGQNIDKQVVIDSMEYADNPNHESYMPSFLETTDRYNEFWNRLANEPGLDFDAELTELNSSANHFSRRQIINLTHQKSRIPTQECGSLLITCTNSRFPVCDFSRLINPRQVFKMTATTGDRTILPVAGFPRQRKKTSSLLRYRQRWGWIFISPWIIGFCSSTFCP
jgi:hypothetical protein